MPHDLENSFLPIDFTRYLEKAVEDHRSPRRFAGCLRAHEFRPVLDCASPLAIFEKCGGAVAFREKFNEVKADINRNSRA